MVVDRSQHNLDKMSDHFFVSSQKHANQSFEGKATLNDLIVQGVQMASLLSNL